MRERWSGQLCELSVLRLLAIAMDELMGGGHTFADWRIPDGDRGKALGKPLYALAESFKFTRLFPLSQYDLPSSSPTLPLSFATSSPTDSSSTPIPHTPARPMIDSPIPQPLEMTDDMARLNPTLDYTPASVVSLIISDLGVLTPSVSLARDRCPSAPPLALPRFVLRR